MWSDQTTGLQNMNRYETDTNGTLVGPTPLFASVWLALFYVLRKSFNERRLAAAVNAENSQLTEKK
jgi:hypothetical protein